MQSTNTGILKPALWHTPAVTNNRIIQQAPDPRENQEGFTSRSPVANRVSRRGPHLHGSHAQKPTLLMPNLPYLLGVRRRSGRGYLQGAEVSIRGCMKCNTCHAHLSTAASAATTHTFANLMKALCNSVLNRESRRG